MKQRINTFASYYYHIPVTNSEINEPAAFKAAVLLCEY